MRKTSYQNRTQMKWKQNEISILQSKLSTQIANLATTTAKANVPKYHRNEWGELIVHRTASKFSNTTETKQQQNDESKRKISLADRSFDGIPKLVDKAKLLITHKNFYSSKAKNQQVEHTFLTNPNVSTQPEHTQQNLQQEIDPNELLKELVKTEQNDNIEELRKLIKITNRNLSTYSNEIYNSSQNVMNAADQFQKQIGSKILYQVKEIENSKGMKERRGCSVRGKRDKFT